MTASSNHFGRLKQKCYRNLTRMHYTFLTRVEHHRRPLSDERLLFVALVYGLANLFVPSQGRLLLEKEIRT